MNNIRGSQYIMVLLLYSIQVQEVWLYLPHRLQGSSALQLWAEAD